MKRCPKCNTVFEDEMTFCKEDGTPLLNDSMPLPSDLTPEDHDEGEQETVLRYKPINFDISNPGRSSSAKQTPPSPVPANQPPVNPSAPNQGNSVPPPIPPTIKKGGGCFRYSLILILGLLIGGGGVLVILGIGFVYYNDRLQINNPPGATKTKENTPPRETNKNSNKTVSKNHSQRNTEADEKKLNGQVISRRASLRASPSNRSKRIARLPRNDRIEIIRRKSPTSSWYEIECEHGARGWISGFSIKFNE
jgi:hypothetical protein